MNGWAICGIIVVLTITRTVFPRIVDTPTEIIKRPLPQGQQWLGRYQLNLPKPVSINATDEFAIMAKKHVGVSVPQL